MAAIALRTERLVTGPLVTPLIRRRLSTLARQTVTLDHLARGRFVFGVGLGVDSGRELSAFGEETDARLRGDITDEAIVALQGLWSGEPTTVHGEHVFVDDVVYLPRPYQQPRIPTWFAARGDAVRPARRAGRFGDGIYPIEVDRSQLARMLDAVRAERGGTLAGFTVALREMDGPEGLLDLAGDADTIWVLRDLWPDITVADTLDEIATPRLTL
jgi:alkanesulfonate monooxygenase SsuD/methylene tetrahydromethanopterin reductase-like flavin-dependent oxidoreductase (luciferase family)